MCTFGLLFKGLFRVIHLFIALFYIYVLKANNCGSAMQDGIGAATAATVSNAELDEKYKRLCHVVAKQAHKAQ